MDDETAGDTTTTEGEASGDAFTIGRVLPDTGSLAYIGPPMIVGTDLAIEDINAAGGVLGNDVRLLKADAGADAVTPREAANRVLASARRPSSERRPRSLPGGPPAALRRPDPAVLGSNRSPSFSDQENAGFTSARCRPTRR
jgi:Periplasmic binding protein